MDDSVFDKFKGFLEILPKSKIKEIYDDTHIEFVKKEEQKEIEENYQIKIATSCHIQNLLNYEP